MCGKFFVVRLPVRNDQPVAARDKVLLSSSLGGPLLLQLHRVNLGHINFNCDYTISISLCILALVLLILLSVVLLGDNWVCKICYIPRLRPTPAKFREIDCWPLILIWIFNLHWATKLKTLFQWIDFLWISSKSPNLYSLKFAW